MNSPTPCFPETPIPPEGQSFMLKSRFNEYLPEEGSWDADAAPFDRSADDEAVELEIRGLTAQKPQVPNKAHSKFLQAEIWRKGTIYKNSIAAKLAEQGRHDLADQLHDCHSTFTVVQCCGCLKTRRYPNRCDLFFCPECAHHLATERKKQVEWWAERCPQPKHVVLTIKNIRDLTPGHIEEFKGFFRKLRRRKFANNWLGGFYRIEITNAKKGWHIHLHALVNAKWIDKAELSDQWRSITNGLGYIVKVKDVRRGSYLHEVTKYITKGHQLAQWQGEDILCFIQALQGQRTFGVFGDLYGLRTEFAEWIAGLKQRKPKCDCGCENQRYYTEAQWIVNDLLPKFEYAPRPPAPDDPFKNQICLPLAMT